MELNHYKINQVEFTWNSRYHQGYSRSWNNPFY